MFMEITQDNGMWMASNISVEGPGHQSGHNNWKSIMRVETGIQIQIINEIQMLLLWISVLEFIELNIGMK